MKTFGDLDVGDEIFIIIEGDLESLEEHEITYIKREGNYLRFYLKSGGEIPVPLNYRDKFYLKSDISFIDLVVSDRELIDFIQKAPKPK